MHTVHRRSRVRRFGTDCSNSDAGTSCVHGRAVAFRKPESNCDSNDDAQTDAASEASRNYQRPRSCDNNVCFGFSIPGAACGTWGVWQSRSHWRRQTRYGAQRT